MNDSAAKTEDAQLLSHAGSNLAYTLLPLVIALISVPPYLQYLGVEKFGVIAVIMAFLAYFNVMDFGLGRAVSRRISQLRSSSDCEKSRVLWTTEVLDNIGFVNVRRPAFDDNKIV